MAMYNLCMGPEYIMYSRWNINELCKFDQAGYPAGFEKTLNTDLSCQIRFIIHSLIDIKYHMIFMSRHLLKFFFFAVSIQ